MRLVVAAAFVTLLAVDAGSGGSTVAADAAPPDPAATSVTVHFHDSSVPPRVQRNWEVTLDDNQMTVVVDSYGHRLARRSLPMSAERWSAYVENLSAALVPIDTGITGETCPGGVSVDLAVHGAGFLDRSVTATPSCAGAGSQQAFDDVLDLVGPFSHDLRLQHYARS